MLVQNAGFADVWESAGARHHAKTSFLFKTN